MTTAQQRPNKTDTPRLTPRAQANLATIVVESDKQAGRQTPQWILDLAATRIKAS